MDLGCVSVGIITNASRGLSTFWGLGNLGCNGVGQGARVVKLVDVYKEN